MFLLSDGKRAKKPDTCQLMILIEVSTGNIKEMVEPFKNSRRKPLHL